MIARQLIAAVLFSALATGAAFAQATTNAPPKPGAATPPPAVVAPPATTPAKPGTKPTAATPAATTPAKPTPAPAAAAPAPAPAATAGARINLNTATAEELDKLPQIGPARAKAIIDARAKGKFKSWDDFVARKIVPSNANAAIRNQVGF